LIVQGIVATARIRRTEAADAAALTDLARTSKPARGYDAAFDSDRHAEGFYRAMGMRRIGEAPSGSIPGRMLPRLAKPIGAAGRP
jgi:hypothetical protein